MYTLGRAPQTLIFSLISHYSVQKVRDFSGLFVTEETLHELSLTQSIVELAIEHAEREEAKVIRSLTLEIGALSGVIPDAVEFAFDVCSKGTLAEGARLEINYIEGRGRCQECSRETELDKLTYACPHCGSLALETLQGKEMSLIEMEID
jgi:hydrogenase nickel incorporation protein HypA/HybF